MTPAENGSGKAEAGPAVEAAGATFAAPIAAEAVASGLFAFIVVAAGLLAERYAIHNVGVAMLATALAGAGAFAVLAAAFRDGVPLMFNPALALAAALARRIPLPAALYCAAAQIVAAFLGVMAAHSVTNTVAVQNASQIETGLGVWLGEFLGTALFVFAMLRMAGRPGERPALIGALCLLAIPLATPSMSFANPALTLARALTDSFTSIRLEDAAIIAAIQLAAAFAAFLLDRALRPAA
jgi:glycerol uptake facilitator-like aquaporin